jgi:molybdate transport system regulatory protein
MKTAALIRFRIDFADSSNIGPGKIELLEAIRTHGSISAAGRAMKLSYRRAWILLDSLNQSFTDPVSVNTTGGVRGGGVRLTPFGELLILRYRELERHFSEIAHAHFQDIQARVKPDTVTLSRVPVTKKTRPKK